MKITSVKTLLAVLFGVAALIFEGITFNGQVQNLLWMILLAYLCVKGLRVAFSEKAYKEEQQRVYQGQALYLDLFGKFGYVLPDAPFVLFLLVCILAIRLPATSVLLAVWIVLWAVALIGAIWLRWYVSKEKRRRMGRGCDERGRRTDVETRWAMAYDSVLCHHRRGNSVGNSLQIPCVFVIRNFEKIKTNIACSKGYCLTSLGGIAMLTVSL